MSLTLNSPVFVRTKAGKPMLLVDGRRYYPGGGKTTSRTNNKVTWYCRRTAKGQPTCRASIVTLDDVIIAVNHEHNH
ncbi:FLYWCH zinc finger domain-containing protein [Phthorimaea operculella]|nr:FLYWCH zinc finger domain-containing protein [Phthorimaea operculella]